MVTHALRFGLLALMALGLMGGLLQVSAGSPAGEDAFTRGDLDFDIEMPTSLTFGPDGRLYVSNQNDIFALTLDPATRDVIAVEHIATDLNGVLGLAFDQTAPPEDPLRLYVSHQDFGGVDGYWGRVSAFTAPDWAQQVIINNLPSSAPLLNHMTNGLAFNDDGRLFIAQGSNTDAGLVGSALDPDFYPESPLSAAILVADVNDPSFDGNLVYNPPGTPLDYNVDLISGDVAVFSPGHRNPYDLVFHSNGNLYATDNGAFGDGAASCDGDTLETSVSDELNLVEEGNYYGFPNLNRGRTDPRQCTYRNPDEGSGPDYTGPIASLARHCSCDGIVEYQGPALGGEMNGDLIIARFTRGDLRRIELTDDGRGVTSVTTIAGDLDMPLDVTVGPDGTLYVADFDDNLIAFFASNAPPFTPTPSPTATPSATPTPVGVPGDANCSGGANSIDAAVVLQAVAGLIDEVGCPALADIDGDADVDAIDAALILQTDAGLI